MSQTQDPRQNPLQDDEIALARVLRALPAGEPSAKVDAAILAAAADAVAPSGRPRRAVKAARWLPTWAIGTAAAAVLAIGVATQLRPPMAPDFEAPASTPVPSAAPAPVDRMDVELRERRDEPTPTFPPPETAGPPQPGRAPLPPPPPPAPVAPTPPALADAPAAFPESAAAEELAMPAPPAADVAERDHIEVTGSRLADEQARRDRVRLSDAEANLADADRREIARRRQATEDDLFADAAVAAATAKAEAPLLQSAPPAPVAGTPVMQPPAAPAVGNLASESAEGESAADAVAAAPAPAATADATTGGRAAASANAGHDDSDQLGYLGGAPAPLPPVAEDVRLEPQLWIERIRDRLRRGPRADALESLRLLRRDHPTLVLPADLAALH